MDKSFLDWIAALQFGFAEFDCGLIHRSSKDIVENLTLDTPPLRLLYRLTRLQVNRLFTARSKQQFHLELTEGIVNSEVKDLNGNRKKEQKVPQKAVIGIGSGKIIFFMILELIILTSYKQDINQKKELRDLEGFSF